MRSMFIYYLGRVDNHRNEFRNKLEPHLPKIDIFYDVIANLRTSSDPNLLTIINGKLFL